ncbi:MAG: ATP synthase subunit a [Parcubacteria group bacterium GW2011_GWC1_38_6]|nr:MAG: ATP synthase subunit a [Parcubacteria group bacterium GW2011_GWC1_38_6]
MNPGEAISLKAEHILEIGDFQVTNALLFSCLVAFLFLLFGFLFKKKIKLIPDRLQAIFEVLIEGITGLMESVLGSRKKAEKYLPFVASIFLFIIFSNWFGLLPGLTAIGLKEHELIIPFLRSPASDINFTLALAIVSVISINILAVRSLGFKAHFSKFFNFQNPIKFFVGILEFVLEGAKVLSFSFRLFGNVFGGEVLLLVIGFLVPYLVPIPFLAMEFFVGFLQAFIFAMLTLVFIAVAIEPHEEHN